MSLSLRSVAAIHYEVEALDQPVRIALQSNLQANQRDVAERRRPARGPRTWATCCEPQLSVHHGVRVVLGHTTRTLAAVVASGMDHVIDSDGERRSTLTQSEPDLGPRDAVGASWSRASRCGWSSSSPTTGRRSRAIEWLRDQVDASLESALAEGFDGLAEAQREFLDGYWERADIEVDGDDELQQALRFALFHLFQAGARNEGRAIPAKGLTGTGYDGHAFWDTESFVLPVLTFTAPRRVRARAEWRHSILDAARERAEQLGLRGAALPWRTIHGEECSGYWPAGTAAFHVNADVADAVRRYVSRPATTSSRRDYGSSCWSRPRACGRASATTTGRRVPDRRRHRAGRVLARSSTTTSTRTSWRS